MIEALRKVIRRMHYPLEVMLVCVRWYAAYPLRHIEEMMAERGVFVDHATVHRGRSRCCRRWRRSFDGTNARCMLGFKSFRCARILIAGIETIQVARSAVGQLK